MRRKMLLHNYIIASFAGNMRHKLWDWAVWQILVVINWPALYWNLQISHIIFRWAKMM